ncbi:WD40 repeat [Streptomyces zhaozhouensis]|uniref:WD40 repeat n=1 Tax=Streptomyces zhaozhouensis TaxID=1300267 RepID=A0A286E465_9ACTN|nr:trypsin-like peptidase domain-containing protein [Streptomyces zhaozhouensis]SOD65683.1 WD40 repeat [Streptomyces zhaozhouensis]
MGDALPLGAAGPARGSALPSAVVEILRPDGTVVGAGFHVGAGTVLTCAHVVTAAGSGPGRRVELRFAREPEGSSAAGVVDDRAWREPEGADIAAVRLAHVPPSAGTVMLGSAEGTRGHRVSSYGFPAQAPRRGHFGYGTAGDVLRPGTGESLLQLTGANDLTVGFSGGPVVDEVTGLVIGMVTAVTASDALRRGQGVAYATPTEVLRAVVPGLAEARVLPYPGLRPFTSEDAAWFHGRGEAIEDVLAALRHHRLVLLLGPSGAGKSSLVQAGVLPALARGRLPGSARWAPVVARPGRDLAAELEAAGLPGAVDEGVDAAWERRLAAEPDRDGLVVVVDQFEELLTQPFGDDDRTGSRLATVRRLMTVVEGNAPVRVLLVMRDDFYPRLASLLPDLLTAATPGVVNVPAALRVSEVHGIIRAPAEAAGARWEDGLVERIVEDLGAADPARRIPVTLLPTLQLALRQLWDQRVDGRLTHQSYQRVGEVTGSLAGWCDGAMARLTPRQRPIARRVLTALVRPAVASRAVPATRQQLPLTRLRALSTDPRVPDAVHDTEFDETVAALVRERVITTSHGPLGATAELVHEALIRDWGDLRRWIDQDHSFQSWLHRVTEQQERQAESGLPEDLLGGSDLTQGLRWAEERPLPGDVLAFLAASRARLQGAARRRRRLYSLLAGVLALALIAAGVAYWQGRSARSAEDDADTAQRLARSRQLAEVSGALLDTDPDLASLLAVQSYRTSPTEEARSSLYRAADLGLLRHLPTGDGPLTSVAFSADGAVLATAGESVARLRDAATGEVARAFEGQDGPLSSVALSPDGATLASAGVDSVWLWDTATGEARHTLAVDERERGYQVAFSPDGGTLATAGDGTVRLWDVATGRNRETLAGPEGQAASAAFAPDGGTLATANWADGDVRLVDMETGEARAFTAEEGPLTSVVFHPNGSSLATTGVDGVRLWDTATGETRVLYRGQANGAAFSPLGTTLATAGDDGVVRTWDVATGEERRNLHGHDGPVSAVAFSPNGHALATVGRDGAVRLWRAPGAETARSLSVQEPSFGYVWAFGPDGTSLASADPSGGGPVRLWDLVTGEGRELPGVAPRSLAFGPDGGTLATAQDDGTVRLRDAATGEERRRLPLYAYEEADPFQVTDVEFSPDGGLLATASGLINNGTPLPGDSWTVVLWDVATGEERHTLTVEESYVRAVGFSPDGATLATADHQGAVRLWDVGSGAERGALARQNGYVMAVAFSPDGGTLATAGSDGVRVWDADTGDERRRLPGHGEGVASVAFSPDGATLVTAGGDDVVRLWDVASGQERLSLTGHAGPVLEAAFSADGTAVATAGMDGTARLWNVALPDADEAVEQICRALDRDLTPGERARYLSGPPADPVCAR